MVRFYKSEFSRNEWTEDGDIDTEFEGYFGLPKRAKLFLNDVEIPVSDDGAAQVGQYFLTRVYEEGMCAIRSYTSDDLFSPFEITAAFRITKIILDGVTYLPNVDLVFEPSVVSFDNSSRVFVPFTAADGLFKPEQFFGCTLDNGLGLSDDKYPTNQGCIYKGAWLHYKRVDGGVEIVSTYYSRVSSMEKPITLDVGISFVIFSVSDEERITCAPKSPMVHEDIQSVGRFNIGMNETTSGKVDTYGFYVPRIDSENTLLIKAHIDSVDLLVSEDVEFNTYRSYSSREGVFNSGESQEVVNRLFRNGQLYISFNSDNTFTLNVYGNASAADDYVVTIREIWVDDTLLYKALIG